MANRTRRAGSHIWFFKAMPSRMGLMLDMTARELERVLYYEDYIVIDRQRRRSAEATSYRDGIPGSA